MIGFMHRGNCCGRHFTPIVSFCMLLVILVVCIDAAPSAVTSNEPTDYLFDIWTTDNGLPQNSINAILQTKDGYLWLATFDGLVRYDGVKFVVFSVHNTPGVTSNRFTSLLEDRSGILDRNRKDAGVIKYHDGKFSGFKAEGQMEPVKAFQLDDAGQILIAATHARYRVDGRRLIAVSLNPENSDLNVGFFGKQTLFSTSGNNLLIIQNAKQTAVEVPANLIKERISSIYVDRRGEIWISTLANHLVVLTGGASSQYNVSAVGSYYEDREGSIWLATSDKQLLKCSHGVFKDYSNITRSLNSAVTAIYEDREGTIWVGTRNRGLCRLRKKIVTAYSEESGITGRVVYPVYEDHSGAIWLGATDIVRFKDGVFTQSPFTVVNPPKDINQRFKESQMLF